MAYIYGVIGGMSDTSRALDSSDIAGYSFGLGDIAWGSDGSAWVFCQANGAITADYVVVIDEDWQADMIDTTNSATSFGQLVGVCAAAAADNEYVWVQVFGVCDAIQVAASAAANVALNSTATAGQIDDDGTAGAETIDGIILTTARAATAGTAPGFLNWPKVGATLS
jgi:hypothetical protein